MFTRLTFCTLTLVYALTATFLTSPQASAQTNKPEYIHIGISTFLTGWASTFGKTAKHAADMLIQDINYTGGIGGVPVRATYIDEGAGGEHFLAEYRRLSSEVDVMFAAVSSGNCIKLSPLAEDLKVLNILWNCGTQKIFEENSYRYVFRTNANATPEMLSMLLYTLKRKPDFKTIAVVNPDYAWGRDSWQAFHTALKRLKPDVKVVASLFPKLGTPDFSTEISRLLVLKPDIIFSTTWGGDLENFLRQSIQRRLTERSTFVLPLLEDSLQRIENLPSGIITGGHGDYYFLHPERINDPYFNDVMTRFKEKTGSYPTFITFQIAQAFAALDKAYKTSLIKNKGRWPSKEELVDSMKNVHFQALGRELRLRPDNEGLEDQMVGTTVIDPNYDFPVLDHMMIYPASKLTPPIGMKSIDWLNQLPSDIVDTPFTYYRHKQNQ